MATAIDTSVIIDILLSDPNHGEHSKRALQKLSPDGIVICDVALAEIVPFLKAGSPSGLEYNIFTVLFGEFGFGRGKCLLYTSSAAASADGSSRIF
jgi:hypothetical protein